MIAIPEPSHVRIAIYATGTPAGFPPEGIAIGDRPYAYFGSRADGAILRDHTLYVVQNLLDKIAKIELNRDATAGTVVSTTTDKAFDTPTTIAEYDGRLYPPNARFTTPVAPETRYDAVGIKIP